MSIIEKAAARLAEKQRTEKAASSEPVTGDRGERIPVEAEGAAQAVSPGESVSVPPQAPPVEPVDGGPSGNEVVSAPPAMGEVPGKQGVGVQTEAASIVEAGSPTLEKGGGDEGGEEGRTFASAATPGDGASPFIQVTQIDPELVLSPEGGRDRLAEEFRLIKRPLVTRALQDRDHAQGHANLVMVTSSLQAEGKSFVSLNLAISIAMEMDSTVLLVDADVAKPGLSRFLGVADRPGLIDRLVDEKRDLAYLLLRTDIPKLTVLPAGSRHKRSTELLASSKMRELLDEMATRYADRIVLFDSPPLLESTEAGVLAAQMGQVVFVVASESTSQMLVKEALTAFDNLDTVSVVLNKVKGGLLSGKYGYAYGYGYGYGSYGEVQE